MTLTSKKLNIMCVLAVFGMALMWWMGIDPALSVGLVGATIYGFHNLHDVLSARVTQVDQGTLQDAIALAVAAHNQDLNDSLSLFVRPVTEHTVGMRIMGDTELQGVDEWGRPDPIRFPPPVARFFPIYMAQTSIAMNYVLTQKMTVQDLNDRLDTMFVADAKWNRRKLLSALFTNTTYNFTDPQFGAYAVSVLANGDAETYTRVGSGTTSVDTHHKGSAALDNALFTDLHDELVEHEENGGEDAQVVAFIPTASRATVMALDGFVPSPDPNVSLGSGLNQYVGLFAAQAPGVPLGYHEDAKVHIREWSKLPDNYVVGITDQSIPPLAMREDPEVSLQGFKEIPGRADMPYLQRIWSRRCGFGAYNRVGAVVYRSNNGTYAVPSGYSAPN